MKIRSSHSNISLYRPLVYFSLYIIVTLLLSFFGPLVYVDYNRFSVLVYMSIFLIVFSLGYKGGIAAHIQPAKTADVKEKYSRIVFILKICIIITFLTTFFHFFTSLLGGKISLSLTSIGQNYFDFYAERRATGSTSISEIISFFSGFPRIVTMVLGVYYFKHLRISYKFLVIAVFVLWIIINTLSYGNQKSLGEVVIYILIVSAIKMLDVAPADRKRHILFSACLLVLLSIAIAFIQHQRLSVLGLSAVNIDQKLNIMTYYNWDHVLFKILGYEAGLALSSFFMGYLAGGYYGLSLCLQLPFVWTYGLGSSFSLMAFLKIIGGVEYFEYFFNQTYIYRMEATTGWHGLLAWNTIFPWLASDFTFVGALIIFIPVAYVYALCWKEIVKYRNPVSILMFSMLSIGLIFVPANNQLLHGYDGFFATAIMALFWATMHKRHNIIF